VRNCGRAIVLVDGDDFAFDGVPFFVCGPTRSAGGCGQKQYYGKGNKYFVLNHDDDNEG
jgi:hypothetical protein